MIMKKSENAVQLFLGQIVFLREIDDFIVGNISIRVDSLLEIFQPLLKLCRLCSQVRTPPRNSETRSLCMSEIVDQTGSFVLLFVLLHTFSKPAFGRKKALLFVSSQNQIIHSLSVKIKREKLYFFILLKAVHYIRYIRYIY